MNSKITLLDLLPEGKDLIYEKKKLRTTCLMTNLFCLLSKKYTTDTIMLHNIQFGKNLTVFPNDSVSKQVTSVIKLPSKTFTDIYNGHSVPPGLVS
jgi:hypothetical protein